MPKFRNYDQEQAVFRQLVPALLIEEDHPARIFDALVEMLNLERVYRTSGIMWISTLAFGFLSY